jgi:hypothetical protein
MDTLIADTMIVNENTDPGSVFNASRPKSAASWGAIVAGALVAAAVSLILLALGTGLGFAAMSPWSGRGIGAGTFGVAAAIWLIVMQWVASIFGGYITGRLRTRWIGTHEHEIFFRDTANGLVMWALSTVLVAALLAAASSRMAADGAQGALESGSSSALAYQLDKLFRSGIDVSTGPGTVDPRVEAGRIIVNDSAAGGVPDTDRAYLVGLVAVHTGLSEADAGHRVDDFIANVSNAVNQVKAAADAARKDAAEVSIYTALSMLIGAFIASVAAVLGGRLRDEHV